jgi:hypothetical protein
MHLLTNKVHSLTILVLFHRPLQTGPNAYVKRSIGELLLEGSADFIQKMHTV